eukprot:CAMPEP_0201658386 /NCGR_PEP_ID=MMETSP0494-20130426/1275_1 /ASSEMBLY_ACC=CAM_ASM_000839 /TAXON_ID=420259 /ORGANISM="Thalassiosira gravida, Strain GMp14c1" /LENGTH=867 /DNA_ID=CAMNT_0048135365 /DNA_START=189 /DNA_END=2792 /DNA_ORIENTATION=-
MIENAAENTRNIGLARSSSSASECSKKERLISRREQTDNDDADGMRSVLEAALGLTSLNGAPARSPARSPLSENSTASSSKGAVVDVESAAAAVVAPSQKTAKAVVPPMKWQGATFRPSATAMTWHVPPPNYNDKLPVFNDNSAMGAPPSLPPSRGIKITYPPPPLYYAANDRGVASYPKKKHYPQFRYPDPPSTSSTSHFPSNTIRTGPHTALPSKRHKINTQSWTTTTPWKQQQTQQEQVHPTDPTTTTEDTTTAESSLNFPETLYDVVSDPINHDIISWLPHGRGFVVHDKQLFGSRILPCHFDGAKYTSFTRRLKRWKFERVPRGPEMGAYYNKFFVRERPELVRAMLYGMEEEGVVGEEGKELNKEEQSREEKKTKKGQKNKPAEVVHASRLDGDRDESRDDAVVEAAVEVRRQRQRQLTCDMDENLAMGNAEMHGDKSEKKPEKKTEKKQKKNGKNKSGESTSVGTATAYDDSVVEAALEFHRQKLQQQQQSKLIELQCSQESSGPKMQQPQYPELPNEPLLASYLGYQGPMEPQRKRKRAEKGQRQQQQQSLTQGSDPERLHQSGSTMCNHGDYLSMSMPHPHAAKMTVPHHNGSIADVSLSSSHWNAMLSQQQRNIISPAKNKQQQCLDNIERQVLSDMSHPRLLKMPSSDSISFGTYPNSNSNGRRNYNSDTINEVKSDGMSDQDTIASDNTTTESSFMNTLQATTHRGRANGDMMQRILSGSKTHKEVMMIAARGLQSRAAGRGYFTGMPQNHQQLPLHQLQQQQLLQQTQHQPMHGPMSPSRTQQQLHAAKSSSRTGYSTSHTMMLRELGEKVGNEIAMMGSAVDPTSVSAGLQDQNYGVGLIHPARRRNDRAFAA